MTFLTVSFIRRASCLSQQVSFRGYRRALSFPLDAWLAISTPPHFFCVLDTREFSHRLSQSCAVFSSSVFLMSGLRWTLDCERLSLIFSKQTPQILSRTRTLWGGLEKTIPDCSGPPRLPWLKIGPATLPCLRSGASPSLSLPQPDFCCAGRGALWIFL